MAAIKRRKLADAVIEEIKRMLASGELAEGDKLPNQNEFAAQLGVSRPSLREAMHTLNLIGAIEQRPGMGTVIKSANPGLWAEKLSPPLVSDEPASLELIEARRFIEIGAVELAVAHATVKDVRKMGSLIRDMKRALDEGRPREYSALDMEFHYQIASAAHNRFVLHMFVTLRGLMEQFIREAFIVVPGLLERSLSFHHRIYEAIRDRSAHQAAATMKQHIQDIQKALENHYQTRRK
jgi:GntR family transcriptional regulator, transcriptional repressor for pyruvate dehydrogenase complex